MQYRTCGESFPPLHYAEHIRWHESQLKLSTMMFEKIVGLFTQRMSASVGLSTETPQAAYFGHTFNSGIPNTPLGYKIARP